MFKSLTKLSKFRTKTSQAQRRTISIIPSFKEVNDAVYNKPKDSKKAPLAYLFGQSQRQMQAKIMSHLEQPGNEQAKRRLWKSTYRKIHT